MARLPRTLPVGIFKSCFRLISASGKRIFPARQVPFLLLLL